MSNTRDPRHPPELQAMLQRLGARQGGPAVAAPPRRAPFGWGFLVTGGVLVAAGVAAMLGWFEDDPQAGRFFNLGVMGAGFGGFCLLIGGMAPWGNSGYVGRRHRGGSSGSSDSSSSSSDSGGGWFSGGSSSDNSSSSSSSGSSSSGSSDSSSSSSSSD